MSKRVLNDYAHDGLPTQTARQSTCDKAIGCSLRPVAHNVLLAQGRLVRPKAHFVPTRQLACWTKQALLLSVSAFSQIDYTSPPVSLQTDWLVKFTAASTFMCLLSRIVCQCTGYVFSFVQTFIHSRKDFEVALIYCVDKIQRNLKYNFNSNN